MSDLYLYLIIAGGFFGTIVLLAIGNTNLLLKILVYFLGIRAAYYLIKLLLLPIAKSLLIIHLLQFKYLFDCCFAGMFLGFLLASKINRLNFRHFCQALICQHKRYLNLLAVNICITYLFSGFGSIKGYDKSLVFFKSCGYTEQFMIFIIAVEILCAIGILFEKTRRLSVAVLMIDMAGAIFTHFHNWIVRNAPDPLGNSLPALAMLTFLGAFLLMLLQEHKQEVTAMRVIAE